MSLKTMNKKNATVAILVIFISFILYGFICFTLSSKDIYSFTTQPLHDLVVKSNKSTVIIDRFEGKYAVCEQEDNSIINIKQNVIPMKARVGDVLNIDGEYISINGEETKNRKAEIDKLTKNLWE